MLRSSQVAWKVSGLFSAIIVLVLAGTAYVNSLDDRLEAMAAARDVSRMHSDTILHSLHRLMSTHDYDGIKSLLKVVAEDNPVYQDIQLVAHEGRMVASFDGKEKIIEQDSWPCTECHPVGEARAEPVRETSLEQVNETEDGTRTLSTVTLLINETSCSGADCHSRTGDERPVAYLQTDYSLQRVDALVARHSFKTGIAVLIGVLLSTVAAWFAIQRVVGARIRTLTTGLRRIAQHDFDFRFKERGNDEFAAIARSFNDMSSQLSSTLTELRRTREYLEGIVEDSADIIITVDPEGLIRKFNSGAERTLGYKRDEVIGRRIEMLFSDPRERDLAIAQLEYTDHVVNYETHFVTKDGRIRDVILTLSRLRRRDGTPVGTYGISKDVTREKRLLRQLLQSEKMAALGQAVTGIQHSVKNVLNVMKGGSYMVKTGLAKDDRELLIEGWEMVQEGISHMTELSTSMLHFARERKLTTGETSLAELLRGIHALSEARFSEKGVKLVLNLREDLQTIQCDRELIHSVVMDLLSNALDACSWKDYGPDEQPRVTLGVKPAPVGEYAIIEVSDNGDGISEEVRAKIFTPFFSTKKRKGTGMGLAVAARVVNSHGGKITVESETGQGATFQVLLPIHGPGQGEEESNVEESIGR
jgi:PAS domain S-box-containing protein